MADPTVEVQPHEEKDDIIRQVEYYFSDDNLRGDSHLLAKAGPRGNDWVSLSEILSFRKMRGYKPRAAVKAALALPNDTFETWNGKFIRRKAPLVGPLAVVPKVDPDRERNKEMVEKPWLTKGMLKPTGFENDYTEVIKQDEREYEQKLFDPEESFTVRIEHAVTRYTTKRKMHQNTVKILGSFLMFGGFSGASPMFTGGISKAEREELDKEQLEAMNARYTVSNAVLDGIYDDQEGGPSWVVDFEGTAKAFLSSEFMARFEWKSEEVVKEVINVMRNFYNYLDYHDVCLEYKDDIMNARAVCNLAEDELAKLGKADDLLPGQFSIACSTLHDGYYKELRPFDTNAHWVLESDFIGISDENAEEVFNTAALACWDEEQAEFYEVMMKNSTRLKIISTEDMGLQVVGIDMPTESAREVYNSDDLKKTVLKPLGKLHCVRCDIPGRAPKDLPAQVRQEQESKIGQQHVFFVDEDTLNVCVLGMMFEATVKKLMNGIEWIDRYENLYPSFYTWTLNDSVRDYKQPGPPKSWMERQNAKKGGEGQEMVRREDEEEQNSMD